MKFADINKKFTELTAEYIAKGYTFNSATMSGQQGEIAKVDLTNGVEIIRIVLDDFHTYDELELDGVRVAALRCAGDITPNAYGCHQTIWTDNCEVIFEEKFYALGEKYGRREPMYDTLEAATAAKQLQYDRRRARRVNTDTALTPSAALIRMLKHRKGFTNATRSNITVTRVYNGYQVKMAGRNGGMSKSELIRLPGVKSHF